MLRQSEDLGMLDEYSPNFVPSIMKGKIEKLIYGDAEWRQTLRPDGLLERLSPENENYFPEVDPMTGQVKKVMPVYFGAWVLTSFILILNLFNGNLIQ